MLFLRMLFKISHPDQGCYYIYTSFHTNTHKNQLHQLLQPATLPEDQLLTCTMHLS